MNIHTDAAGAVSDKHILSKGFSVFDVIEVNDIDSSSSLPQYTNEKIKIVGGYWHYVVKDMEDKKLWEGWWNSNEEFDQTVTEIESKL